MEPALLSNRLHVYQSRGKKKNENRCIVAVEGCIRICRLHQWRSSGKIDAVFTVSRLAPGTVVVGANESKSRICSYTILSKFKAGFHFKGDLC